MDPNSPDAKLQRQVLQHTLREVALREELEGECCVICLDVLGSPCEPLPCGHRNFDEKCIRTWLAQNPTCPLCKAIVPHVVFNEGELKELDLNNAPTRADGRVGTTGNLPSSLRGQRVRPPCPNRNTHRNISWPPSRIDDANPTPTLSFRRMLYRTLRFSKHVGSNRLSRYIDVTPILFCNDPELVRRARMFIRRELKVFSFLTLDDTEDMMPGPQDRTANQALARRRASNAEFLLEYIIAILKSVDIQGSAGQAENMLADFLGREEARLFWHELRAWLRSPYMKLEDWDRAVQYPLTGERERPPLSRGKSQHDEPFSFRSHRSGHSELGSSADRAVDDRYRDRYRRGGDFYRPIPTASRVRGRTYIPPACRAPPVSFRDPTRRDH